MAAAQVRPENKLLTPVNVKAILVDDSTVSEADC